MAAAQSLRCRRRMLHRLGQVLARFHTAPRLRLWSWRAALEGLLWRIIRGNSGRRLAEAVGHWHPQVQSAKAIKFAEATAAAEARAKAQRAARLAKAARIDEETRAARAKDAEEARDARAAESWERLGAALFTAIQEVNRKATQAATIEAADRVVNAARGAAEKQMLTREREAAERKLLAGWGTTQEVAHKVALRDLLDAEQTLREAEATVLRNEGGQYPALDRELRRAQRESHDKAMLRDRQRGKDRARGSRAISEAEDAKLRSLQSHHLQVRQSDRMEQLSHSAMQTLDKRVSAMLQRHGTQPRTFPPAAHPRRQRPQKGIPTEKRIYGALPHQRGDAYDWNVTEMKKSRKATREVHKWMRNLAQNRAASLHY